METALTNAIEAIDQYTATSEQEGRELIAAKCRGLMRGYDARWRDSNIIPSHVEVTLKAPLLNHETNRLSRTWSHAGKLDVLGHRHGNTVLIDHKTTSQEIADPNAPFRRQLVVEAQATGYMLLAWYHKMKIDECVWDMLRKPSIQPKSLTKADAAGIVSKRTYFGHRVSQETLTFLQLEQRENFELYEARLANDCTVVRPDWYFQRQTVPRLDIEMLDYANDLWQHGQDLLAAINTQKQTGRLPVPNSAACMIYNTACNYLGICSGNDTPDSDRWQKKKAVHSELPELEGDGREVLTHSRVRCFQTCRRKEYFQYQLGLERQNQDEKEALYFGTLWHLALEVWWRFFIPSNEVDHDNGSSEQSANAVDSERRTSETTLAG